MSSPAATPRSARRGMWRWSVAVAATAAFVVSGSGLVVFAQSGDGQSQGPQFVPADASAYVELRLDMPAGQDEAVAQMMTAFPGFADAGSFDLKMDELVGGLAAQMGMAVPEGDLIGDVLTGEVGLALGDLESAMMGGDPTIVLGMAAADAEVAGALMEGLVAQAGPGVTESSYNDVAIITDPASSPPMSMAMHDGWVLMASGEETMASVIDVLDGSAPSLADDADFAATWSRLPAGRLGAAWMDFSSLGSVLEMGAMVAEGEVGMGLPMSVDELESMLPTEMVASLVAEDDRLNLEVAVMPGEMTPAIAVGESELAMSFPADTQVYFETRELGATVEAALNQVVEMMAAQTEAMPDDMDMGGMSEIEALLGEQSPITAMIGAPLPEFLDFVGDVAVGTAYGEDGLWLGIAGEIIDPKAADDRIQSILTVLRMATMQMAEEGVLIDDEIVGYTEITTITLPPLEDMMAESGLPSVGDTVSVAIHGDTLLIGLRDFVQWAITTDGSDSLAVSEGYVDALGDDTVNSGLMYADVGSMVSSLDPILVSMVPEYAAIAPYAAAFDRVVVVGTTDDDASVMRMTVIVGQ